jgi:hypothetical protein
LHVSLSGHINSDIEQILYSFSFHGGRWSVGSAANTPMHFGLVVLSRCC